MEFNDETTWPDDVRAWLENITISSCHGNSRREATGHPVT